jgi:hypothetical protein
MADAPLPLEASALQPVAHLDKVPTAVIVFAVVDAGGHTVTQHRA